MKPKRTFTLCAHCHEPILNRTRQAKWHGPDHPECYEAHLEYDKARERKCREHQKEERKKPVNGTGAEKHRQTGRPCPRKCKKCRLRRGGVALLPQNYHYACPEYYSRHNQHARLEDEYLYAAWGYAGHVKTTAQEDERSENPH